MIYGNARAWKRSCTRRSVCLLAMMLSTTLAVAQGAKDRESVPALFHQGVSISRPAGYQQSERLIISEIWMGTPGRDAVVKYSMRVKVNTWTKKFTVSQSDDKKTKEVLSVTLYKTTNSHELSVHFEHTVYEKGEIKLQFSGITRLHRI